VNSYDDANHTYTMGGRRVPSVTQVLGDLLPQWQAGEWYLQRGRAVHACCAMIARGQEFEHDPQIVGQVTAARLWFAHVKPVIVVVEKPMFSRRYQFAGTPDLVCEIDGALTVVDFKASVGASVKYQTGAYGLLYAEHAGGKAPRWGVAVELHEDGTYRMTERYKIESAGRDFLALLRAWNIRRECGANDPAHLPGSKTKEV
jgi:hypothetical protein